MPKVSVIVPVYGVEKYIERCARSLFEQTLQDMEFIFVNDKTPDLSIDNLKLILKSYPHRENQVKIISHDKNLGLPAARKTGLMNAMGEYVIHCDSDDWVDKKMYEHMYETSRRMNSDIVICNYKVTDGVHETSYKGCYKATRIDVMSDMLKKKIALSVCNKLVKRSLLNNPIIFPKYNMAEDFTLMFQLVYYSKRVDFLDEDLYYYFMNPSSITQRSTTHDILSRFNQSVNNSEIIYSFIKDHNLSEIFSGELLCYRFKEKMLISSIVNDGYYTLWKDTHKDINNRILFSRFINSKEKVIFFKTYISHLLYLLFNKSCERKQLS